jgi:EF hand
MKSCLHFPLPVLAATLGLALSVGAQTSTTKIPPSQPVKPNTPTTPTPPATPANPATPATPASPAAGASTERTGSGTDASRAGTNPSAVERPAPASPVDANALFQEFDSDRDQKLSSTEFNALAKKPGQLNLNANQFRRIDSNADGSISLAELRAYIEKHPGQGKQLERRTTSDATGTGTSPTTPSATETPGQTTEKEKPAASTDRTRPKR